MKSSKRLRDLMTLRSRLRYLAWRLAPAGRGIDLTLHTGPCISVAAAPSTDLSVAYEVFVMECYKWPSSIPEQTKIEHIVDLGANVGYSVLYLAHLFPEAHIDAFEPHPENLKRLSTAVTRNKLQHRVSIHPVGAGVATGRGWLEDDFGRSSLSEEAPAAAIEIDLVDFFDFAGRRRIDLLKMDIEGGEYAIFNDPRFPDLDIGRMVFEWHASAATPEVDREIFRRLESLGWRVERGTQDTYRGCSLGIAYASNQRAGTGAGC
jgi:FkbM family methyltransferase